MYQVNAPVIKQACPSAIMAQPINVFANNQTATWSMEKVVKVFIA